MEAKKELREHILSELRMIILDTLNSLDVKVFLFGSWARNEEKVSSDIDIALETSDPFPPSKWLELKNKVEESSIPYNVDIVDLSFASSSLVQNVKKEGIVWKDY